MKRKRFRPQAPSSVKEWRNSVSEGTVVEFKDSDDKVYVVDLNVMTEKLKDAKDNSSMVKVQRKDLAAGM